MKANREIGRWTLAGTIVVLGGCAGTLALGSHPGTSSPPSATRLTLDTSSAPVPGAHADSGATARYGSVAIAVAWPARSQTAGRGVQAIPLSATSIALSLASGSTTVATASITSPATNSTLATIPVGTYTLTAEALRADGSDAASASAPLDVVADRVAQAKLSLVPTAGPSLSGITPTSGLPSGQIDIDGSNLLPPTGGTYSVFVDNQAVASSLLQPGSSTIYLMGMPSWAQNSGTASISVSVDGVTAPQTEVFTVQDLACLTLTPTDSILVNSTTQQFTANAYSDAACRQPISGIPVNWALLNQDPAPSGLIGATQSFTLSGTGVFETYVSTGSAWVQATAGNFVATTSITASVSTAVLDATPAPGPGI